MIMRVSGQAKNAKEAATSSAPPGRQQTLSVRWRHRLTSGVGVCDTPFDPGAEEIPKDDLAGGL